MADEDCMRIALAQAEDAFARGDWPVGALLLDPTRSVVLSLGQNRQCSGRASEACKTGRPCSCRQGRRVLRYRGVALPRYCRTASSPAAGMRPGGRCGIAQPKFFSANDQLTRLLRKVSTNFGRALR